MRIHSDLRRRGRGEAKSARGAVREADRGTDTRWQAREAVTRTQLTSSRGGGRIRKEAGGGGATPLIVTRISASSQGTRAPSPVPASFRPPPRQLVRLFPPVSLKPFGNFRTSSAGDPRACSRRGVGTVPRALRVFSELHGWISEGVPFQKSQVPFLNGFSPILPLSLAQDGCSINICFMNELVSA